MPLHKLADGPITLTVARTEATQGNFGPQIKFVGDDGTEVYVNELSAMKQLARINLTLEEAIGRALYMEQIKKDGKTFTNIALAGSAAPRTTAAPTAPVAAPAPKQTVAELAAIYAECVSYAMATLGAKCEEAGVGVDASALQAAAATLFIKATRS